MSTPGTPPGPAALQPGFVLLDRFRLEHELGPGDLGTQWRAFDQKEDRAVLVEVLPPGPPLAPQEIKALQETCGRITKLRHEGLARVVQFGFLGPQPVVARELVPGLSLGDHSDRHGPVEPSVARAWLAPVAAAMDHAHSQEVVHGHVRAAAVRFRSDGSPVLTGFELSPFQPDPLGGPRSPEQRLGRAPTPASDRYALAALAGELVGDTDAAVREALRGAQADEPGKRPASAAQVIACLEPRDPAEPPGIAGGVAAVLLGLALMVGGPYLAMQRVAARTRPPPASSRPAVSASAVPDQPVALPSATPEAPAEASPVPELPPRLELGAGAPELGDPRQAVGRFTARALGQEILPRTGFLVNLDGRAGVILTAYSTFGSGAGLVRGLRPEEVLRVAGPRLEIGEESFQLGPGLDLPKVAGVTSFTKPSRDMAAFLVDQPRAGFLLRTERVVRDEPLVLLTWTGELYRAKAEPQVTGVRSYAFLDKAPPASALGAPVLDRQKRVVGIHVASYPGVRGVTGICTDSGVLRMALLRALAPLFAQDRRYPTVDR